VAGRRNPEIWEALGHAKLYETTPPLGPWWDIIPVNTILGHAILVPNYDNNSATIPAASSKKRDRCFLFGRADGAETPGSGSKSYYVNQYAVDFTLTGYI
jgi:hypothetical protein